MGVSGQFHTLATLLQEKERLVPTGEKLRWASELAWILWIGENIPAGGIWDKKQK
jgi:hypothetical protein